MYKSRERKNKNVYLGANGHGGPVLNPGKTSIFTVINMHQHRAEQTHAHTPYFKIAKERETI